MKALELASHASTGAARVGPSRPSVPVIFCEVVTQLLDRSLSDALPSASHADKMVGRWRNVSPRISDRQRVFSISSMPGFAKVASLKVGSTG